MPQHYFNTRPVSQQSALSSHKQIYPTSHSPAVQILDVHPQTEVLGERDDVQLLALPAHGLHLAGAVGGHVQVQAVGEEREETVAVLPQVACERGSTCIVDNINKSNKCGAGIGRNTDTRKFINYSIRGVPAVRSRMYQV